ncbi:uncharacterized protein [Onthophagus taurus]|uniref:uncharacterized protein n=1 Tax=Onthophagus taurus TaxID=166361 RepID=UPI0039BE2BDD
MDKLTKLKLRRSVFQNRLTEARDSGQTASDDSSLQLIFLEQAKRADKAYDEFTTIHNQIIGLIEETDFDDQDKIRKDVDTAYFTIKALFHKMQQPDASDSVPAPSTPKLNKIVIPTFDGNYKNWPTFFDLFRTLIHENDSLSPVAKYQYLLTSLKGEAFNLLKGLPVTNENYSIAYTTLKRRYQNKRHLATLYFNEIINLKPVHDESSKSFRHFIDTFKENVEGFRSLKFPVQHWDFLLFNLLLLKINTATKTKFESEHASVEIPTYTQLIDFLEKQAKALNSVSLTSNEKTHLNQSKSSQNIRNKPSINLKVEEATKIKCVLCSQSHPLYRCSTFHAKSAADRLSFARDNNLCRNCLNNSHQTNSCSSTHRCRVCHQKHHSSLHFDNFKSSLVHVGTTACDVSQTSDPTNQQIILPIAFLQIKDRFGTLHLVRALIDSGSMSNFITAKLAKKLRLPRTRNTSLEIRGLNSMTSVCNKGKVKCYVQPCHTSQPSFDFDAIITPNICSDQPTYQDIQMAYEHLKNLNFQKEFKSNLKEVDLLLGAELVPQILTSGRIRGGPNDPVAVESVFGWLLMGRSSLSSSTPTSTCLSTIASSCSLDHTIQKFWEIESIPVKSVFTPEEEACEKHFRDNYTRTTGGRFIVSLPFKSNKPTLGDSYQTALKRFKSLENRLLKNPSLHDDYISFMSDYLSSGHMSLNTVSSPLSSATYYIPHHCVMRAESASTKLRVVFDASAISSNGKSLNDNLLIGPKLQQDIVKVLLNFRCYKFAFTCDIKQMYRQILISPQDRNYQRILWRFSPQEPLQEFILNTVTYGVSSAPFLALRTLLELANLYINEYPLAANILKNNIYVDDIVTGTNSIKEGLTLQKELITLLKKGGFELRKWASNCNEILRSVSESDIQTPISMDYDEISCVKVLGLQWDPNSDMFHYSYSPRPSLSTKRSILSDISRIYDPLGFLTPCTFKAKCFIQQLWQLNLDWDEIPPYHIAQNWQDFRVKLKLLSNLRVPRLIIPDDSNSIQLHLFCDASQSGYCAVAYFRCVTPQSVTTSFICGKSRVAPLKTLSVPRLELCAAVLLADLLKIIQENLSPEIKITSVTAWSDSQVVLNWVTSLPHK